MTRILRPFDYVYYRLYSFYMDKGDPSPHERAWSLLALLQVLLLFDLWAIAAAVYERAAPAHLNKAWIFVVLIALSVANWYRYGRRLGIRPLMARWAGEERGRKRRRGLMIAWYVVVSILLPVLYLLWYYQLGGRGLIRPW